jgi:hemolysin activation/secretion protein
MYLYTQGYDILEQHYYSAQLGYDWQADQMQYAFTYANNQFRPQFLVQAQENAVPYSWSGSTLWMKERDEYAALSFFQNALLKDWDSQSWTFGYEQTHLTNISTLPVTGSIPSMGNIKGLFAAWRYVSARSYARSVSNEDGIDLTLQVSRNSPDYGSDYNFTTYSGKATTYWPTLFQHHVLVPSLNAFYSSGQQLEQSNYTWRNMQLRGYPSNALSGNKGIALTTEYRFPILTLENGLMHGYTFFDRVWGKFFFDLGGATFNSVSNLSFKRSIGAELNL